MPGKGVFGCYENRPEVHKEVQKNVDYKMDTSHGIPKNPFVGEKDGRVKSTGDDPIPSFIGGSKMPAINDTGKKRETSYK